ncbi:transcription factor HES-1-like [Lytechinus pictus]|uniref:transcription factor HES-1-like n=1 Tax=Lytechinus pictus TaxID=7653 RepID=UPI0030BA1AE7
MPLREVYFAKMPVDTKPKIHEGRKSSKPQMEKRRRARINDSLGQLKSLILEATNKDSSRHSKLEKADILEMTVKHLRNIQRNQLTGPHSSDPNMVSRFRQGYSECIHEVARFFTNIENIGGPDMRLSLINHLANTCNPPASTPSSAASQPSPPTSPVSVTPIAPLHAGQPTVSFPSQATASPVMSSAVNTSQVTQPIRVQISPATSTALSSSSGIVTSAVQQQCVQSRVETVSPCNTNNVPTGHTQVLSSIPLGIPGSLPSGEITLVLPPQALAGGQLPSHFIPVYAQSAPVLASPTMSPASMGPVCAESPKAYAQVHIPPQTQLTPPQQVTAVQTPTLVALPAPAPAPVVRPTKVAVQTVPQPLTPPKTVLHTVNVQQAGDLEPVWRPWSHRRE